MTGRFGIGADSIAGLIELAAGLVKTGPSLEELKELIVTKAAEVTADLAVVKSALGKVGGETSALLGKVSALEAKVANADNVPQEIVDAVADIKASVQRIDDMVPDAPAAGGSTDSATSVDAGGTVVR